MTTFRRTAVRAALVAAFLLTPGRTTAGQTNAFDSLKLSYEMGTLEIGAACVQREKDALKQYGKALDVLLTAFKQKGDLEPYLIVATEKKRFSTEGTVPNARNVGPPFADAVAAYQKTVADAEAERNRQAAALLKSHVAALDSLMKTLTQSGKIEDAKAVKAERDKAVLELAELEPKLSKGVKAPKAGGDTDPPSPLPLPVASRVYVDQHEGVAGSRHENNVYTLKVDKLSIRGATLRLWGFPGPDSYGDVTVITPDGGRTVVYRWSPKDYVVKPSRAKGRRDDPLAVCDVTQVVTAPGVYQVEFRYTRGAQHLALRRVELEVK